MKRTFKKPLSLILALCLAFSLLPTAALAADAAPPHVYVGGTDVVSGADITYWKSDGEGGITGTTEAANDYTVKYDPTGATATLTLSGAVITKSYEPGYSGYRYGFFFEGNYGGHSDVKIDLIGTNSVASADGLSDPEGSIGYGIYVYCCNIEIGSSVGGTFSVTGGSGDSSAGIFFGSYANLSVTGNAEVSAFGGEANVTFPGTTGSVGVHIPGTLTICDTARLTATGGAASEGGSIGVRVYGDTTVAQNAALSGTGAASGGGYASCGVQTDGPITINGELTATGGDAQGQRTVGYVGTIYGSSYGLSASSITVGATGRLTAASGTCDTTGGESKAVEVYDENALNIDSSLLIQGAETEDGALSAAIYNPTLNTIVTGENAAGGTVARRVSIMPPPLILYDVWVGGVQVTSANRGGVTGTGISGTVTFDPTTTPATLTLSGAEITGAYLDSVGAYGIYIGGATGSLKLALDGSNTITGTASASGISCGVYSLGASVEITSVADATLSVSGAAGQSSAGIVIRSAGLTLSGFAAVTASGGSAAADDGVSYGVSCSVLTMSDTASLAATSGTCHESGASMAVYASGGIANDSGHTFQGAATNDGALSAAIYNPTLKTIVIGEDAAGTTAAVRVSVTPPPVHHDIFVGGLQMASGTDTTYYKNGDTTSLSGSSSDYNAMLSWSSGKATLTLSGLSFSGTTGYDNSNYSAVYADGDLTIVLAAGTENSVEHTGDDWGSRGVFVNSGDLIIEGSGSLTAKGGTSSHTESDGVYVSGGDLTIRDRATVTAIGGSGKYSNGIKVMNGELFIEGSATVNATGGENTSSSSGSGSYGINSGAVSITSVGTVTAKSGWGGVGKRNAFVCTPTIHDGAVVKSATETYHALEVADVPTDSTYLRPYVEISTPVISTFDDCFGHAVTQEAAPVLTPPAGTGYEFAGWYASRLYTGDAVTDGGFVDGETYYAKWTNGGKAVRTTPLDLSVAAGPVNGSTMGYWYDPDESASGYNSGVPISTTNHPAKTLILDGATIDCSAVTDCGYAVKLPAGSTISLTGSTTNAVRSGSGMDVEGDKFSYGILLGYGSLTILGSGSLNVTSADVNDVGSISYGIFLGSDLIIGSASYRPTVTVNAGSAVDLSFGVYANTQVLGGNAAISCGTANINATAIYGTLATTGTVRAGDDPTAGVIAFSSPNTLEYKYLNVYFEPTVAVTDGTFAYSPTANSQTFTVTAERWESTPAVTYTFNGGTAAPVTMTADSTDATKYTGVITLDVGNLDVVEGGYALSVTATDGTTTKNGSATVTISKATPPTPARASVSAKTDVSVTLAAVTETAYGAVKYGYYTQGSSIIWGTGNEITGLTSGMTYYFMVQYDGNGNYESARSTALEVTTLTYIDSIAVTGITAPAAGGTPDMAAACAAAGISNTAPTVTWTGALSNGKFKYNTAYTAGVTLTVNTDYALTSDATATIDGIDADMTDNGNGTVTVSYAYAKTAKAAAPTATMPATTYDVANAGAVQALTLNVADIIAGQSGVTWTMTETADINNILTLPATTTGMLAADSAFPLGSVIVAANPVGAPAKTATVQLAFTGGDDYTGLPADITLTFSLAKGDSPAAPSAVLNYADETISGVAEGMEYVVDAGATAADWAGATALSSSDPLDITAHVVDSGGTAKHIHIRVKAVGGGDAGTAADIELPARPVVPALTIDYAKETTVQIVPATMEHSTSDMDLNTWTFGTDAKLALTPGTIYYFRTAASESGFAGMVQRLIVPARPTTPTGSNITAESSNGTNPLTTKLTFTVTSGSGYEYTVTAHGVSPASDAAWAELTGGTAIDNIAGRTSTDDVYIRIKATGSAFASEPYKILDGLSISKSAYSGTEAGAPNVSSKTNVKVVLNAVTVDGEAVEYAKAETASAPSSGWQDGVEFTGLRGGAEYFFFARVKENDDHYAGAASEGSAVTTKINREPPTVPNPTAVTANSITFSVKAGEEYCLIASGAQVDWMNSVKPTADGTHTFTDLEPTTLYYIFIRTVETETHMPSNPGSSEVYTLPATPTAAVFTVTQPTATSGEQSKGAIIPVDTAPGKYEYRIKTGTDTWGDWTTLPTTGLTAIEALETYELRVKAASPVPASAAYTITINRYSPPSSGGTPSVTIPATSNEGSVDVKATVNNGTATISVTDTQINQIISNEEATGTVKVDVSGLKVDEAVIPAKLVTAAADASGSEGLEVEFSTGAVALDKAALESVGNKSITVSVEDIKTTELTAAQKETLGDQADTAVIVDVNVLVNGVKTSEFNGGLITVSVPYTPKTGEDTSKLVVWYLADDGTITAMNGKYDAVNKGYVFTTTHLSTYVLTSFPFTDVAADTYYYSAVAWAVANETTEGTSATTFSPNDICTRAQMVTFLWRAMGSPEPTSTTCPFTDVSADAYYYKAVLWAAEKGITEGTSETTFSPNDTVTRAQVVTLEWRAAGKPAATAANPFGDVTSGTYYEDAVLWAVAQKITEGTSTTTFSPADPCTRAQIVTFLYRYLAK